MARHQDDGMGGALDAPCRTAVRAHRTDAFDNVDVAALLCPEPLSAEDARWIGRHLMENGQALAAHREGQAILAAVERTNREGFSVTHP